MNQTLNTITDGFWKNIEELRFEFGYDEFDFYYSFLFILLLYKEGALDKIEGKTDEKLNEVLDYFLQLYNITQAIDGKKGELLKEVFVNWKIREIRSLIEALRQSNPVLYSDVFPSVFDDLIYRLLKLKGKAGWSHMLPQQLVELVTKIASLPNNSSVYNPFAGLASFGIAFENSVRYIGQELNFQNYGIGILRSLAHNRINNFQLSHGNSLLKWNPTGEKFDLVVSFQPFNLNLSAPIKGTITEIRTCDEFVIEKGLEVLKESGKLITWMPKSFYFNEGSAYNLRKYMVDNDLIEYIIEFPGNVLANTKIPFVVLILNKAKKSRGIVKMVKTIDHITNGNDGQGVVSVENLLKSLSDKKSNKTLQYVNAAQLVQADYDLSISPYFTTNTINYHAWQLVPLADLLTLFKGKTIKPNTSLKRLRIRDLSTDPINYSIDTNDIEPLPVEVPSKLIDTPVLLIANKGKLLKPSYLGLVEDEVAISNDIFAFTINEQLVDTSYLINELCSQYVNEQVDAFRRGIAIPFLKAVDFLKIKVKIPKLHGQQNVTESKSVQKLIVSGLQETHFKSKERELLLQQEILGIKNSSFRELSSIRHTLGQYLNSLESNVSGTLKFLENNKGNTITLESIYSKNINRTLGEHLLSIQGTIKSMNKILSSDITDSPVQNIASYENVIDLVTEAMNRTQNEPVFKFEEIYIDSDSFKLQVVYRTGEETRGEDANRIYKVDNAPIIEAKPIIKISREDFFIIFSNIVTNAVSHGFKGSVKNNKVRISISLDIDIFKVVVEVSNNGKPFPTNYTIENLTTWGDKSVNSVGTGIGGSEINRIIKANNSDFSLELDSQDEYPVKYVLRFPFINQIQDEN